MYVQLSYWIYQGQIQDFKLGGAHLKKIAPSGGRGENFGVFRLKNHDLQFLYFVLLHLQTLFRSFTLTIFIPFFHTNNLYSVCSHLQSLFRSFSLAIPLFHYFTLTIFIPFFHLQSLFRSFTLAIPLFHTCNLYFIHTMHHNTLSNLL